MKEDIYFTFLEEVKKHSIIDLSLESGVPKTTIYNWLQGNSTPTLIKAQKVLSAMGLELLIFEKE